MAAPALRIPVTVDLGQFKSAMDEAGQRVDQASGQIESRFAEINRAAGALAVAFTAAGGAIATSLFSAVSSLAKIGDLSDDLRLPVNLIQALSVASDEARVPASLLTSALEKFTEASKAGGKEAEKFEKALGNIGSSFLQAFKDASTQEERLKIISDALKSTSDEVKRAQLSLQAFGTDNERLISVLGGGASAFEAYRENAARLGLEINESLVRQAQDAKSQMLLLSRVLTDEFSGAIGGLIPLLVKLLPYLKAIADAGQLVGAIFATDETASVSTLKRELDGLIDRWVELKEKQEALSKGGDESDTQRSVREGIKKMTAGVIDLTEDVSASARTVEADLIRVQQRIETVKKLLASKDAAPAEPDKPAFAPRRPLIESSTRDRFDGAADAIQKRTAALEAETAAIDLGTEARERAKIAAQLETVAKQINKEAGLGANVVTQEQTRVIDEFSAAYGRAAAALERARSPLATFARDAANVGKQLNQFAASSLDSLTNNLADVVTGTKSAADAFKSMATSIINDLARIAIRQSITGPLAGALGGFFNPSSAPLVYGPGFAEGTDFAPGGMALVGERGPEIVNLPRGSQVIPNNIVKGMGGGGTSVTIQNSYDFRGADPGSEARMRSYVDLSSARTLQQAIVAVDRKRSTSPSYLRGGR